MEWVTSFFSVLFSDVDSPAANRRWRITVSSLVVVFTLHILWAWGYGQTMGLDGFAREGEMKDVSSGLSEIKVQLLEKSIIDIRVRQCEAANKQFFTARLTDLLIEYQRLTGRAYPLPQCSDL